ncbi:MAG: hypothetical protein EPO07_00055 [Verrucomicrobia bacterium]|nr:MAG: hypothetical protein EPO07_00055 [Verrucomicrobiota bacterium]
MRVLKKTILGCATLALCVIALFHFKHRAWPYGVRTCCLPCMMSSLRCYAYDHEGWYPKGGRNPVDSLRILTDKPDYIGNPELLAGISGDREATKKRITLGLPIDDTVSSWVYFPGFCESDDSKLAIIWERHEGIGFNGHLSNGHAVGFADGHHEQVPQARWAQFLSEQQTLRQATFARRLTSSLTP